MFFIKSMCACSRQTAVDKNQGSLIFPSIFFRLAQQPGSKSLSLIFSIDCQSDDTHDPAGNLKSKTCLQTAKTNNTRIMFRSENMIMLLLHHLNYPEIQFAYRNIIPQFIIDQSANSGDVRLTKISDLQTMPPSISSSRHYEYYFALTIH